MRLFITLMVLKLRGSNKTVLKRVRWRASALQGIIRHLKKFNFGLPYSFNWAWKIQKINCFTLSQLQPLKWFLFYIKVSRAIVILSVSLIAVCCRYDSSCGLDITHESMWIRNIIHKSTFNFNCLSCPIITLAEPITKYHVKV